MSIKVKYIVLDSNIFFSSLLLKSPSFQTLLTALIKSNFYLAIPKAILLETSNLFFEEFKKIESAVSKIGLDVYSTGFSFDNLNREIISERYRLYILNTLKTHKINFVILDFPETKHEFLFKKAIERSKPFKNNDGGGYRDALIWESIISLSRNAETDHIFFISGNFKDFGVEYTSSEFHPDLVRELSSLNIDKSKISYYTNLHDFLENEVVKVLEKIDSVEKELQKNTYENFNLDNFIKLDLENYLLGKELKPQDIKRPESYRDISILQVAETKKPKNIKVRSLYTDRLLITFDIEISFIIDFYLDLNSFFLLSEITTFYEYTTNWNNSTVYASEYIDGKMDMSIIFNPDTSIIESVNFENIYDISPVNKQNK